MTYIEISCNYKIEFRYIELLGILQLWTYSDTAKIFVKSISPQPGYYPFKSKNVFLLCSDGRDKTNIIRMRRFHYIYICFVEWYI